jgi:hypothetical protein
MFVASVAAPETNTFGTSLSPGGTEGRHMSDVSPSPGRQSLDTEESAGRELE